MYRDLMQPSPKNDALCNLSLIDHRYTVGIDCPESAMYLSLFKDMVHRYDELTEETEPREEDQTVLPKRCQTCRDLPYCDRDYCLCWYH